MVTAWYFYLSLWLPIPLLSVILLTTFGQWRWVRTLCRTINNLKFRFGTHTHISLRATLFTISLIVFALTTQTTLNAKLAAADMPSDISPNKRIQFLSQKWRAERNFWIGALIVVLWYVLGGLLRLREENAELREQLKAVTEVVEREQKSEKDKKED